MHPEVTSDQPGRCPKCGMKLLAARWSPNRPATTPRRRQLLGTATTTTAPSTTRTQPGCSLAEHGVDHGGEGQSGLAAPREDHVGQATHDHSGHNAADGIEWEDDMVEVNRLTTTANMRWKFVDRTAGAGGAAIDWRFTVGDRVKIRLVNEMDSDHPMHHPFHLHGAGRFLVLARNGVVEPNLVWKDTVLVRTGQTVDILFDVTEPGLWMAHCHIAEHMQSGMMFSFTVARAQAATPMTAQQDPAAATDQRAVRCSTWW